MAVVPEDGTGLAAADSYADETFADAYLLAFRRGSSWESASAQQKEDALKIAAQYLDAKYGHRWKGRKANELQGLDWPRKNVVVEGFRIDSEGAASIPRDLKRAQCELALIVHDGTDPFAVLAADSGTVKAESSELGPLKERFEYFGGKRELPKIRPVDLLLRQLVVAGTGLDRA